MIVLEAGISLAKARFWVIFPSKRKQQGQPLMIRMDGLNNLRTNLPPLLRKKSTITILDLRGDWRKEGDSSRALVLNENKLHKK